MARFKRSDSQPVDRSVDRLFFDNRIMTKKTKENVNRFFRSNRQLLPVGRPIFKIGNFFRTRSSLSDLLVHLDMSESAPFPRAGRTFKGPWHRVI